MGNEKERDAERQTRNRGLQEEDRKLHEPGQRPPHSAAEPDAPEPERPATTPEKADQDVAHLENPPQSDGPRERSNDAV